MLMPILYYMATTMFSITAIQMPKALFIMKLISNVPVMQSCGISEAEMQRALTNSMSTWADEVGRIIDEKDAVFIHSRVSKH